MSGCRCVPPLIRVSEDVLHQSEIYGQEFNAVPLNKMPQRSGHLHKQDPVQYNSKILLNLVGVTFVARFHRHT
jgi:hypothetical protein